MQTVEGTEARAPVSSELAAMFTYDVLPTLQKHYYDEHDPELGWEQYQQQCTEFAKKIGLPPEERYKITIPCFISLDWAATHTWVRQFIAMAGRSGDALAEVRDEILTLHVGRPSSTLNRPEKKPTGAANLRDLLPKADRDLARSLQGHEQVNDSREHYRRRFIRDCGYDPVQKALCDKARSDPAFITIIPEQIMPLSKVSPDIHSPVEHMVGTIKRYVKREVLEADLNDSELWKGRTYQKYVNDAVSLRGNGEDGRKHISKSVEKQKIICQILAEKAGTKFMVDYVFGGPGQKKQKRHEVEGTAGAWIRSTKWT